MSQCCACCLSSPEEKYFFLLLFEESLRLAKHAYNLVVNIHCCQLHEGCAAPNRQTALTQNHGTSFQNESSILAKQAPPHTDTAFADMLPLAEHTIDTYLLRFASEHMNVAAAYVSHPQSVNHAHLLPHFVAAAYLLHPKPVKHALLTTLCSCCIPFSPTTSHTCSLCA